VLMNSQAPLVQDPSTQYQLLTQQLQQQAQTPQVPGVPQVQNPWAGAAMLANALMTPQQQPGQNSGSGQSPLQNLLNWLNSPGQGDWAGGPDDSDEDSAGS
jgi:hypothetical protein